MQAKSVIGTITLFFLLLFSFSHVSISSAANIEYTFSPNLKLYPGGKTITLKGRRVVDLGRNTSGRVIIKVKRGWLRASYSESDAQLRIGGDMGHHRSQGRSDAPESRVDFFKRGKRISPGIRGGVRYLLLQGRAVIDSIAVRSSYLPASKDNRSYFASSNQLLNRIWRAGQRTLELSTTRGKQGWLVTDAAKRDHLPWLGDLEMENLAATYASRLFDKPLKNSLNLFACQQYPSGYVPMTMYTETACPNRPAPADGPAKLHDPIGLLGEDALPSYTASWISTIKDRYFFSGEKGWVRRLLPNMQLAVEYFKKHRNQQGLFANTGQINWRAFDQVQAVDVHTNLVWAAALDDLAFLEKEVGQRQEAYRHQRLARQIKVTIRRNFFDRKQKLFQGGSSWRNYTQDANVFAVLTGAAPNANSVLNSLKRKMSSRFGPVTATRTSPYAERFVSPFMSGWHLIASLDNNRVSEARWMLRRLWGRMAQSDPGTMWEAMGLNGKPIKLDRGRLPGGITSLAHGWSAAPTYALPAYITGIKPTSPGWRTWQVKPTPLGLKHARASIYTPRGYIQVSWHYKGKRMQLRLRAPHGSRGQIILPCGKKFNVRRVSADVSC